MWRTVKASQNYHQKKLNTSVVNEIESVVFPLTDMTVERQTSEIASALELAFPLVCVWLSSALNGRLTGSSQLCVATCSTNLINSIYHPPLGRHRAVILLVVHVWSGLPLSGTFLFCSSLRVYMIIMVDHIWCRTGLPSTPPPLPQHTPRPVLFAVPTWPVASDVRMYPTPNFRSVLLPFRSYIYPLEFFAFSD